MKKDWKDIEGRLVRIDIGSTFTEANSDSTDAGIICFTTDGHIVLNGVDYLLDTDEFKNCTQTTDWVRKYIQQGDAEHPFLQGRMTDDTYNIGWMLDGWTYKESVSIPLISEEQQGLVESQSYTEYLQPLLQGKYDERIDAVEATADAAKEKAESNASALLNKVDNDDVYKNVKASAEWSQNYVMTDRSNVGKPFLQYQFDTDNGTLDIGWLTMAGYAYTVRIPLVDDTHNAFFDPYYYSEFIQPLFNGEFAYKSEVDDVQEKADANVASIKELKPTVSWLLKYILMYDAEHPFLQGRMTDDTYNIGWMLDGWTYKESVSIPLISEEQQGLVESQSYTEYLQPLLQGKYDERIDANAAAIEELKKSGGGGSSSYTLPMATKNVLGGVKVGGDVREANSLPLEGAVISRELDGTILVPYASASKRGESYDKDGAMTKAQARKLYEIEAKAQVNKIESIKVNGVSVSVDADKCANVTIPESEGILNLGKFNTESEALDALLQVDVCGNADVSTIVLKYGDNDTTLLCFQELHDTNCRQVIFNKLKFFHRTIYFADATRKSVSTREDWQFLFPDRLTWDASSNKYVPNQFGVAFNNEYCSPIPTATSSGDGLMSKADKAKLDGINASTSDAAAISALNAKVEQMQQEIDELKKLLTMA